MSASSRNSVPSPPPIVVKRQRAPTVTETMEAPKPGKTIEDYTENRLREALKYADTTLRNTKRKLSPLGMRAVLLYKDAIKNLLRLEENTELDKEERNKERGAWISLIRMHEESVQYTACLILTSSPDAQTLQDEIIELQRIAFFTRYGDMFEDVCKRLRRESEAKKVLGWRTSAGKYWTEINHNLENEKEAWKQVRRGKMEHGKCPTHMAISDVCRSVGFNTDEMLVIIDLYATRNEIVHANFETMIKEGKFHDIASQLYNDYCDIPRVVSAMEPLQAQLMSKLLQGMIDRWFTRDPEDIDNLQMWFPTQEILLLRLDLRAKDTSPEKYKSMVREITTDVYKRLCDEERKRELVKLIESNFNIKSDTPPRVKRVSSIEYPHELKKIKLAWKDWNKIMHMAAGTRKLSETYAEANGYFDEPHSATIDPFLDLVED